jgi:hypothetical protein
MVYVRVFGEIALSYWYFTLKNFFESMKPKEHCTLSVEIIFYIFNHKVSQITINTHKDTR